jgi:hypothetical protein
VIAYVCVWMSKMSNLDLSKALDIVVVSISFFL